MNKELREKLAQILIERSYKPLVVTDVCDMAEAGEEADEIIDLFLEEKNEAEFNIGSWLSAALDDENVCAEMKMDIVRWFTIINKPVAKESEQGE